MGSIGTGHLPMSFEATDSELADQLKAAGHRVTPIGRNERLTGNAGFVRSRDNTWHYAGVVPVQIYEIQLGGSYAPEDHRGRYSQAVLVSSC